MTGGTTQSSTHAADPIRFVFAHTMLRIKEPQRSLWFYQTVLGMKVLKKIDYPQWKFSIFFLCPASLAAAVPATPAEVTEWMFTQSGLIELTHNWGTESDANLRMHNGNEAPQGYGHICIAVPDIEAACARFESLGAKFCKRLGEGGMKSVAFIEDPDGYRFEIVEPRLVPAIFAGGTE